MSEPFPFTWGHIAQSATSPVLRTVVCRGPPFQSRRNSTSTGKVQTHLTSRVIHFHERLSPLWQRMRYWHNKKLIASSLQLLMCEREKKTIQRFVFAQCFFLMRNSWAESGFVGTVLGRDVLPYFTFEKTCSLTKVLVYALSLKPSQNVTIEAR